MYFKVDFSCNKRGEKYENSGERCLLFLSLLIGWIPICTFPGRVCHTSWIQKPQLTASFHSYLATFYDFNIISMNSWTTVINYFIKHKFTTASINTCRCIRSHTWSEILLYPILSRLIHWALSGLLSKGSQENYCPLISQHLQTSESFNTHTHTHTHTHTYFHRMMLRRDPVHNLSVNLYDIHHCCVYSPELLMMDRGTVRNMQSFIPKINWRN